MTTGLQTIGYRVWLGSQDQGFCGCGIIVDNRHVISCNHVVRQCLGRDTYGDACDDLVGQQVIVRCSEGLVSCEVVRNNPLPFKDFGEHQFDDLTLLRRLDKATFPAESITLLASTAIEQQLLRENRAQFVGTGLGVPRGTQPLTAQFMSVPFEGRLLVRAEFKYWYHTSEDLGHLISEKGCSGGAAASVALPDTVIGLIQGGLNVQSGLVIPASIVGSFLESCGIVPRYLSAQQADTRRPSEFRPMRKRAASLAIKEADLAECDRVPQKSAFQAANTVFVRDKHRLLFAAIAGSADDLPDLSNRKFGEESIAAYWNWIRHVAMEHVPDALLRKRPSIHVRFDPNAALAGADEMVRLLANGITSESRLRNSFPDKLAIAGTMDTIDSPIVIFLVCSSPGFEPAVMSGWRECIGAIADARQRRPLVAICFVECPDDGEIELSSGDGIVVLPALQPLTRADVNDWARAIFNFEPKKVAAIMDRVQADSFPLARLHSWLFEDA